MIQEETKEKEKNTLSTDTGYVGSSSESGRITAFLKEKKRILYFYFLKVSKTVPVVGQCHVISLRISTYFT